MPVLAVGSDSYFLVDGVPYQRGQLLPVFEVQLAHDNPSGKDYTGYVSFRLASAMRNVFIGDYHYSNYTDAATGNPFASYNDLVTWICANVFAGEISGGGTSGITFTKVFRIVAAPAAPDEKAAGDTFTDAWLVGADVTVMMINGVNYTGVQIDHDDVAGSIGPAGSFFSIGDTVVIFKN